jgi:N-acetylglutamate synthase-like GNAT family acetyltransferase
LRSVLTLPPVRKRGIGTAILAFLEAEARIRGCRAVWVVTDKAPDFFLRLGYRGCGRSEAPKSVSESAAFVRSPTAVPMTKRLD